MSELFDTSSYLHSEKITSSFQVKGKKQPTKQKGVDPSWDEPELDWQPGDSASILDSDQRVLCCVERVEGKFATISFPDYQAQVIRTRKVKLSQLIATKQTYWRRDAWKLEPILLEKLGAASGWRSHELAQELNLPLGQVSQCLEKLELEGKVWHCNNWTYSPVSAGDSPLPDTSSDCNSSGSPTMTSSVQDSYESASQKPTTTEESTKNLTGEQSSADTSGLHHHHVNRFQLEEKGKEDSTTGMDSPHSLGESGEEGPRWYALKTSPDYSTALTFQEANSSIFRGSSKSFPRSGTMQNGKLCQAPHSVRPGKEKGSSLLPTPTALSGGAGLMKLENYLRELGAIDCNQVVNPVLLEVGMGLPVGWTNPRMPSTALEFLREAPKLGTEESPSETPSTTQSPPPHSQPASDCWNPRQFGGEATFAKDKDQLTIFFDCEDEPPCPEDCKDLEEFNQKWAEWEIRFPQLSGKILEESEAPGATREPPILLEKESDRLSPHQEEFLEELRDSSCNTGTEIASEHHQILLEKAQEEVEDNPDEDKPYSHITAAEILEQEEWEKPYTAAGRPTIGYAKGQTGQLYSYGQRKKSSYLNPDSHYYWGYSYQVWDGFRWRSKSKSVPLTKLSAVREAIASRLGVEAVLAML